MEGIGYEIRNIDETKGKGLFAVRDFEEGDRILVEKPLLCCQFSWSADYGYSCCDNCMKPLETAEENVYRLAQTPCTLSHPECCETNKETIVRCSSCGVFYCCEDCRKEAYEKYHKTLCVRTKINAADHPLTKLKECWKQIFYPPEDATIMLPARMIAYVNQADDKTAAKRTFAEFCHGSKDAIEIPHNLTQEKFADQLDDLRTHMANALDSEFVPHWFTPDGFKSLLALVGTNGQGIGTSAFGCWVKNVMAKDLPVREKASLEEQINLIYDAMDNVVGEFLNNEGSGLYVIQSKINHSCRPNAMVEFPYSNSTLVVTALENISAGDEICISYLPECELDGTRHSRQKSLEAMYMFKCQCPRCLDQADDASVSSEDSSPETPMDD